MSNNDSVLSRKYILITPAKNEEDNLANLIRNILEQTIPPSLWVIVDDASIDSTPEILRNVGNNYKNIRIIRLQESKRDLGIHLSFVCRTGFDFAIRYCKNHEIDYDYIGLVDADMILEKEYFEKLIKKFEFDSGLGIASGDGGNIVNNQIIPSEQWRSDSPSGGARLWRVECFKETDGYVITCAPDTISNIKAMLKGWKTKKFTEITFISTRAHSSATGLWNGFKQRGNNDYYLYYPLVYSILKGMKHVFKSPYYIGFAYLYGYFSDLIFKRERIDDDEVRYYFKYIRPREIWKHYINHLKIFKNTK